MVVVSRVGSGDASEMKDPMSSSTMSKDNVLRRFNMTPASIRSDIRHLTHWIKLHPDIPKIFEVMTEEWLENQLIMNKNSLARCKRSIETYWRGRSVCPQLFENRDLTKPAIRQSFSNHSVWASPTVGGESICYKVAYFRPESSDQRGSEMDMLGVLIKASMAVEHCLKDGVDFTGYHLVVDLHNFRVWQLKGVDFTSLSMMSTVMKCYPVSVHKIYVVNYPYFVEKVIAIFLPFLSSKIQSRIQLSSNEELSKEIESEVLPNDYGGTAGNLKDLSKEMEKILIRAGDYITWIDRLAREKKIKSKRHHLNLTSSFRKLEID